MLGNIKDYIRYFKLNIIHIFLGSRVGSIFQSNKVIGLIDKQTGKVKVEDKINIVLTPSYYWIKRAYLDVNFTSAALKYAPSIFEGMLPEGNYAYYALKDGKEYIFFAYEPDEIISSIKAKGIQPSQIAGIYFAQNEMGGITAPIQCNKREAVVLHNDTLLQVPIYLVDESKMKRSLEDITQLSKHKIVLHKSSITHSMKELAPIMIAVAALIVLYAAQLLMSFVQKEEITAQPSVFQEYRLPSTFVQNSSIEKKLKKSFKAQTNFRKVVFAILKLPLRDQQRIQTLDYDKENFVISFGAQHLVNIKEMELHLKKSLGKLVKIESGKNVIKVKII